MKKYDWKEVYELAKNADKNEEAYNVFTQMTKKDACPIFYPVYSCEKPTPIEVFNALSKFGFFKHSGFYISSFKDDDNGTILPRKIYNQKLMYHKKWARKDIEVKEVTYDIVGYKRKTTHLPCAVIIANVNFNF